jgi:hypothetical protein
MAISTLTDVGLTIAGTDLSDHCKSVTIDDGRVEYDDTVLSHTAQSKTGGLPTPKITAVLIQDFAASKTHEILKAALNVSTAIIIRRTAGSARGAANPEYAFTGKLHQYQPIAGKAGDFNEVTAVFEPAGKPFTVLTTST